MSRRKGLCGLAGLFVVAVAMMTTPAGAQVIYPYGYPYAAPGPAYVAPAYPPGYSYPPAVVVAAARRRRAGPAAATSLVLLRQPQRLLPFGPNMHDHLARSAGASALMYDFTNTHHGEAR